MPQVTCPRCRTRQRVGNESRLLNCRACGATTQLPARVVQSDPRSWGELSALNRVALITAGGIVALGVVLMTLMDRPSSKSGPDSDAPMGGESAVSPEDVRAHLDEEFSDTSWHPLISSVEPNSSQAQGVVVETSLDPDQDNAPVAHAVCGAALNSGVRSVMVRGQGGTSLWICHQSGYSSQGSGYVGT